MNKIELLKNRAAMLAKARSFFAERNVIEVDTPHLSNEVIVDSYIDLIPATFRASETYYLNSSPESSMKQLLASGMGDIYQLGHVFRDGELGSKHHPEFTLCEWYRIGYSYHQMIEETLAFIQNIVGIYPVRKISYRQAFLEFAQLDPFRCSLDELRLTLLNHGFEPLETEDLDELTQQILVMIIEPQFMIPEYIVLTHFPPSMASLAKVIQHEGFPVAERFEIYFKGLELANGFNELSDSSEQLARFEWENQKRALAKKAPLPIAHSFIHSLKTLPLCCGVAVGFDRLLMLKYNASSISEVLSFSFD
jgi:lysyl-tRNA synthetase class 2